MPEADLVLTDNGGILLISELCSLENLEVFSSFFYHDP